MAEVTANCHLLSRSLCCHGHRALWAPVAFGSVPTHSTPLHAAPRYSEVFLMSCISLLCFPPQYADRGGKYIFNEATSQR